MRSPASRGYVLVFHSQNVPGYDHSMVDDHVALHEALGLAEEEGLPVLRLLDVVRALRRAPERLPHQYVCITFDDGTDYDWRRVAGPTGAIHEPFIEILKRHGGRWPRLPWRRKVHATSFVIASPQARADIMRPLAPVLMSEDWWAPAQASGSMDIGLHGWDHVHPSVDAMRSRPHLVEKFHQVASAEEAQLQVAHAGAYVRERAGRDSARLFAYPYGQVSDFLADSYFPAQGDIEAAFDTAGEVLTPGMDPWRLPRMVCGWHWTSRDQLRALLRR